MNMGMKLHLKENMKMHYRIDRDKWACGSFDDRGDDRLLNEEGYMCVLGQCYDQEGATREDLFEQHSLPKKSLHYTNLPLTLEIELPIYNDMKMDSLEEREQVITSFFLEYSNHTVEFYSSKEQVEEETYALHN